VSTTNTKVLALMNEPALMKEPSITPLVESLVPGKPRPGLESVPPRVTVSGETAFWPFLLTQRSNEGPEPK